MENPHTLLTVIGFLVMFTMTSATSDIRTPPFSSLVFVLAGSGNNMSENCLQHSRYYCVNSWYTEELRARVPVQSDIAEIYALARVNYQLINWFNVAQQYAG
ncbi:uncharacterized protein LOC142350512 [Convolutriloba macropyga]|uniref:uncharacterized protein LOC142350512 n=1 Tax=Convolutriloba macropyga TaxID=536237 RepID=UPI003F522349